MKRKKGKTTFGKRDELSKFLDKFPAEIREPLRWGPYTLVSATCTTGNSKQITGYGLARRSMLEKGDNAECGQNVARNRAIYGVWCGMRGKQPNHPLSSWERREIPEFAANR